MSQLSKLQQTFQDSVLYEDKLLSTAWISAKGRAKPEVQLSIYSYAYRARLIEVLADDYPAMLVAIGEQEFNSLTNNYIKTYPSKYFSLRDFGRQMPSYLLNLITKNPEYKNNYWLYELCLFEWTLGQSFDAADANVITEQNIAKVAPEHWPELKFTTHPSVQCVQFEYNVSELWRAFTQDDPTEVEAQRDVTCTWLFWRQQLVTHFRSMDNNESLAFTTLQDGKNFNEICEALTSIMDPEQVPLCVASYLKTWISQDLISGM